MTLTIDFEAEKRLPLAWERIIREIAEAAIDYEDCPYECELSVLITDNERIREINRAERSIDAPTDVLSFPMLEYRRPSDFEGLEEAADGFNPDTGELMLGDIVLNQDRIESQAWEYGHTQERELAFLTAHSMLHLFGYDHMEEEERLLMEQRQEEILQRKGYTR